MNLFKLTASLFLGAFLSSCGAEDDILQNPTSSDKVEVSVSTVPSDRFSTKAVGGLDGKTDNVDKVQIYVFRESGDLDAFVEGTNKEPIKIEVTKGTREFYAVANPQESLKLITKKSVFLKTVAKLASENSNSLLMAGSGGTKLIESAQSIEIIVSRYVSRIQLQYSVDFKGGPWEGKTFTPDSIYITNANSETVIESVLNESVAAYAPTHGGWFGQNAALCNVNPGNWGETPAPIGSDNWLSYYVYKHDKPASSKFADVTSLVITGHIEGDPNRHYYTARINTPDANITGGDDSAKHKFIQNNVIYGIKATIKGTGTPEPGDPINFHVTVVPKAWTQIWQEVEFK